MADFRRASRAITKAGQIKGGVRHEKDDRFRIEDRSRYVLGWTNERKIDALLAKAAGLTEQLAKAEEVRARRDAAVKSAFIRGQLLARLAETHEFAAIDYQALVNRIADLRDEHRRLIAASAQLADLDAQLEQIKGQINGAGREQSRLDGELGRVGQSIRDAEAMLAEARVVLAEPHCEGARTLFTEIAALLAKAAHESPRTAAACDRAETRAGTELMEMTNERGRSMSRLSSRIVAAMGDFRRQYPVETSELDNAVESAHGYRELYKRLTEDDLPRFQHTFKTYLNQNTIRDIAGFHSQLTKHADLIRGRIDTINASLVGVDYNPGRYIRLEPQRTSHLEIKEFQADLRACTDNAVSG